MIKIIIDENLPKYLKLILHEYETSTVQENGWAGMKNGDLIAQIDSNLMFLLQQIKI